MNYRPITKKPRPAMLDGVFYLERAAQVPGESLPLFSGMTYSNWRAVLASRRLATLRTRPGSPANGRSLFTVRAYWWGDDLQ